MHFYFRPSRKSEGWLDDGQIIAMPQSQGDIQTKGYDLITKLQQREIPLYIACYRRNRQPSSVHFCCV